MQEQLLTKCPHCGTTFRLAKEHLEIAGGAVRCGACYQVFHAKEHIVKTAVIEEIRAEKPQQPAEEAPDPFEEFELNDGDPYEQAPNWDADDHPDADLFSDPVEPVDDATLQEFGLEPEPEEPPKKKKGEVDESWAEAMLEELGEDEPDADDELIQDDPNEDNDFKSNTGFGGISSSGSAFDENITADDDKEDEISESFKELHYESFDKFGLDDVDEEDSSKSTDESWAQKMLEELEAEEAPKPPSLEELSILDDEPEESEDNKASPFTIKDLSRSKEDAIAKAKAKAREEAKKLREKEKKSKPAPKAKTSEDDEFFGSFTDEMGDIEEIDLSDMGGMVTDEHSPIPGALQDSDSEDILEQQLAVSELHFGEESHKKRSGFKTAGLILLNIIALLGLAAQHAYFNFDELARQDTYRPYYKIICQQLGCELPTRVDISKIQGTNLIVRSHPMEPNALVIDAIVYNRAKYTQPYPDLQLSFEDINGNPIASRRFSPKEYIQDQNINYQKMPPNTPVHITLEIVDPGPHAVNYQIDFLPQTTS